MQQDTVLLGIRHVFISYSHNDRQTALQLQKDLEAAGVRTWLDRALVPGTLNWQKAIRQAISEAYAVVVIATRNSGQSDAVYAELELARIRTSGTCPIIPLWFEGEEWAQCVPLEYVRTQFVDFRSSRYTLGLSELIQALHAHYYRVAPHHYEIPDGKASPHGYFNVQFGHDQRRVAFRTTAYPGLGAFLDEFYMSYLYDDFKPYTYGESWAIQRTHTHQLLLPWEWLFDANRYRPIPGSYAPLWETGTLESHGLIGGTSWQVCLPKRRQIWAIATNSRAIHNALTYSNISWSSPNEKFRRYIDGAFNALSAVGPGNYGNVDLNQDPGGYITVTEPEAIDTDRYPFRLAVLSEYPGGAEAKISAFAIQSASISHNNVVEIVRSLRTR